MCPNATYEGSHNDTVFDSYQVDMEGSGSKVAIYTTIVFALMVMTTNGGLLTIFAMKKQTRKYLTLVQATNMSNLFIGALSDLMMRLPLFIMREEKVAAISPALCMVMRQVPDYFMMAILLCLPLITGERILKLLMKNSSTIKSRRIIGAITIAMYLLALFVSSLPMTAAFGSSESKLNTRCLGRLRYGHVSFAFIYTGITVLSTFLTFVFSVVIVLVLRAKLRLQVSRTKKMVLKRGVVSACALTATLAVATVPFAISLQLVLSCGGNKLGNLNFCDNVIPYIFRASVVMQKLAYTLLPVVFLGLNPMMRRKIWLSLRQPNKTANIATLSSNTTTDTSKNTEEMNEKNQNYFITLSEENQFPVEVIRRVNAHCKSRQSFYDMIDVLSVISEKSEPSVWSDTLEREQIVT